MQYIQYQLYGKEIYVVDMKQATKPFSYLVEKTLEKYGESKYITVISNKNNYAHGAICSDCGYVWYCKQCDVAVPYHKDSHGSYFGLCHYCKTQYDAPGSCSQCQGHNIDFYGTGSQQLQGLLQQKYGLDSVSLDATKLSSISKILQSESNTKIIISTNLLLHPNTKTDILIVLQSDFMKQIPDFNARWQQYCTLVEAVSKHPGKQVILQTYDSEDSLLHLALTAQIPKAQASELHHRALLSYPPFVEMCLLMYKDEVEAKLFTVIHKLYQELLYLRQKSGDESIDIISTPPLIYKLHGKFRYTILIKGKSIRSFVADAYVRLEIKKRGFMVDWMPMQTV